MAGETKLRVGVVGCGGLGSRHARNVASIEGAEVVAVSDYFLESAEKLSAELDSKPAAYSDHRKLLEQSKPDAVVVVTPNHFHAPLSIDAAQAGVHVFCEKPMALTVEDCDAMIAAAKQAGVLLMVGYVRRYQSAYREMKRRVAEGEIGEIRMAHAVRLGRGAPGGVQGWQTRRATYGGQFSMYSHELDQLAWLAGEIHAVHAVMDTGSDPEVDLEDSIFIGLEFVSGAIGSLSSSRVYPVNSYELGIAGTEGALKITKGGSDGPLYFGRRDGDIVEIPVPANDGFVDEMKDFFSCIREDRQPESDGPAGRRVLAVAAAAHEAARTGRRTEVRHPQ